MQMPADTLSTVFEGATFHLSYANLVLDATEDGILEVMSRTASEPNPFLQSSDEDDLQDMPRWAMTYTPYTPAGECKRVPDMRRDAMTIASQGFKALRLFSTDCAILPSLEQTARQHSLKFIPTIYIPDTGIAASVHEQVDDVLDFARWDLIAMIAIGNEALYYDYCSAEELSRLIATSTKRLRAKGYAGHVTTIDHPAVLKQNAAALCPHLDVLASSVQPFFDSTIRARDAGRYLAENLRYLGNVCGDARESFILETGWPRKGKSNGVAVPGVREQRLALQEMLRAAGQRIALATFEDELWREPGDFLAEQFWGCGHLFNRTA